LSRWLEERVRTGDGVAQHGFQHRQTRRAGAPRQLLARLQGGGAAEFPGLDPAETERAVDAGRRVLRTAGIDAHGFVAPAYAYTRALRAVLAAGFDWWASVWGVHDGRSGAMRAPALALGTAGPVRRALSPPLVRAGALLPQRTIASTCTRPTSTTPGTSWPWNGCCAAPTGTPPSPTTTSRWTADCAPRRAGLRRPPLDKCLSARNFATSPLLVGLVA
jgi:hypothetical protein